MTNETRYRLNSPHVVSETVEGETIVVNLESGTYYSIKGDAILLFDALTDGATLEELAAAVASATGESAAAVAPTLEAFAASLAGEGLLVARPPGEGAAAPVDVSSGGAGLLAPAIETYSDMQDLILLDPVHEVNEQGWPHVQANG